MSLFFWRPKGSLLYDKKYPEIIKTSRMTFHAAYYIYNYFLKLLLDIKNQLIKDIEVGKDTEFNKAFLLLIGKSIQHTESIFLLAERGLYGDAIMLYRNIISAVNMMYYLHFNPNLIQKFLTEDQDSYQDKSNDFSKLFSEGAVSKCLESKNVKSVKNLSILLSKASHASAFGSQLYSRRSSTSENVFYMRYSPSIERERAAVLFFMGMVAHLNTLDFLKFHRETSGLNSNGDFWKRIYKKTRKMDIDIKKLSAITDEILDKMQKKRNTLSQKL